ncbi:MAG TPA: hypothetical protein VF926_02995 [Mycobacterium sp.]
MSRDRRVIVGQGHIRDVREQDAPSGWDRARRPRDDRGGVDD